MCSILGVSFAPGSTINRHKLATALLAAGESRGRDAAGFAWVSPSDDGMYKKNVTGSKLHVGRIPADASAMILHTRAATHGSPRDMENNHPIESPSGDIRLVHNGVVYNHEEVRELLGKVGKGLPEVDSSVIPALIETYGIESTDELAGYASAAWFDKETSDAIHLARFKTSTVFFATLFDGSLAFASTADILAKALNKVGLAWYGNYPSPFDSMAEGEYFQIMGGEIISESEVEWSNDYYRTSVDYSAATSGGASMAGGGWGSYTSASNSSKDGSPNNGATKSGAKGPHPAATPKAAKGSEDTKPELKVVNHNEEKLDQKAVVAMVFSDAEDVDDFDDPRVVGFHEFEDGSVEYSLEERFFTTSHDGDFVTYTSIETLMSAVRWHAGFNDGENVLVGPEEGLLRWVNHFSDIGHLSYDGREEISWVDDAEAFREFEIVLPSAISDGLGKLRSMVGA